MSANDTHQERTGQCQLDSSSTPFSLEPSLFPLVKLHLCTRILNGGTPKSNSEYWNGEVPFVTPSDLRDLKGGIVSTVERTLTAAGVASGSNTISKGVMISGRAPVGYVGIVDSPVAFNQGCKGIESEHEHRFLSYAMVASSGNLNALANGTTFLELSTTSLENYRIPLPSLETQQRIADYLDVETGQIDTTVSTLDELIEEMKSRRVQVIIKKLEEVGNAATFSSGEKEGDPGTSGERDSTALSVHLGLLADFISGVGFPVSEQGLANEEIPFHKVASLKNECLNESTNTVSKETAKKLRARIIPEDSVLMAKVGEAMRLNRFSMNATKCCIDNNMLAIVPQRELLNSEYLRYVLSMFNIQVFINPGPVPSLDVQGLRMFSIALLPLEKQKAVVSFLDSETARIDKIISTATELRSELLARRSALITEVVTGQRQV